MNVLIACEESQAVCIEMRRLGHRAFSCDIQDCSGGHPEWHIKGDVLPILNGNCEFDTADGTHHTQTERWDLIIAHPPCAKLSCAGAVNLGRKDSVCKTQEWREKFFNDRTEAAIFFMSFLAADCERVAVENPAGYMCTHYSKPTQYIEPFMFGDPWKKRTGLWLRGLPPLEPTQYIEPRGKWVQQNKKGQPARSEIWDVCGVRSTRLRAKTFPGIARAMAEQWAGPAQHDKEEKDGWLKTMSVLRMVGDTFYYIAGTLRGNEYVASDTVAAIEISDTEPWIIDSCGCYHSEFWMTRAEAEAAPPPVRTSTVYVTDKVLITGRQTNADRIRAMTDEELADFMLGVAQNGGIPTCGKIMRWIEWLKQEVDYEQP